jgi:hypothetical protein
MKEDAVGPSFFNFFLGAWQKRLFSVWLWFALLLVAF